MRSEMNANSFSVHVAFMSTGYQVAMNPRYLSVLLLAAGLAGAATAAERPLAVDPAQSHIDVAVKATMDSFVGRDANDRVLANDGAAQISDLHSQCLFV